MRSRLILMLVAVAALAAFAAVNWTEFVRPTPLSYGWGVVEAPLGLVLLAVIAVSWVGFMLSSAVVQGYYERAARRQTKQLEAQRELADRAEASRFHDLRSFLESESRLAIQRENATAARLENLLNQQAQERQALRMAIDRLDGKLGLARAHEVHVDEVIPVDGVLRRTEGAHH